MPGFRCRPPDVGSGAKSHAAFRPSGQRPEQPPDQLRRFPGADFAGRMHRAATQAQAAGPDGVLVTPGPDRLYLTGYAPVAITERITLLVLGSTATSP